MPTILPAHFDGEHIRLDEPFDLPQGARLLVTLLSPEEAKQPEWKNSPANFFVRFDHPLARAYGPDEPEYTLDDLI